MRAATQRQAIAVHFAEGISIVCLHPHGRNVRSVPAVAASKRSGFNCAHRISKLATVLRQRKRAYVVSESKADCDHLLAFPNPYAQNTLWPYGSGRLAQPAYQPTPIEHQIRKLLHPSPLRARYCHTISQKDKDSLKEVSTSYCPFAPVRRHRFMTTMGDLPPPFRPTPSLVVYRIPLP